MKASVIEKLPLTKADVKLVFRMDSYGPGEGNNVSVWETSAVLIQKSGK